MPYHIVRQEISTLNVDAVIHFTNNLLQVDDSESKAICKATDAAVITPGSQLPAKHIIHIAYPTYADDLNQAAAQLRACYLNGLSLAAENHCLSVALPLFTDCVPGYPDNLILHAATTAISHFLKNV
jgi:O-acetyl-ADP-ribose deacetylase (regulator of RNase III)